MKSPSSIEHRMFEFLSIETLPKLSMCQAGIYVNHADFNWVVRNNSSLRLVL